MDKAKQFTALPGDYPWAGTRYTREGEERPFQETANQLGDARGMMLNMISTDLPWRRLSARPVGPQPDGAPVVPGLVLRAGDATWSDATDEIGAHGKGPDDPQAYGAKEWWRSNYRQHLGYANGDLAGSALYWWERRIVEERGTYDMTVRHVAWYDSEGFLAWHYEHGSEGDESLTRYRWNAAGKIDEITTITVADNRFSEYGDEPAAWSTVWTAAP